MSDEIKNTEEKRTCFCQSKGFKKFLIVTCGTFVGVFLALSLFAAVNKPPMPCPCPCGCHKMARPDVNRHFEKGFQGPQAEMGRRMIKDQQADRPMPPRADQPAPVQNLKG